MTRTLIIDRDTQAPARAREAVASLPPAVDERLVPNATLLVSELVTNAVKYGSGPIELRFDTDSPERLRCEVGDQGVAFIPTGRSTPRTQVGGWGLYLVDELAASWDVPDDSTHVWFELALGDG